MHGYSTDYDIKRIRGKVMPKMSRAMTSRPTSHPLATSIQHQSATTPRSHAPSCSHPSKISLHSLPAPMHKLPPTMDDPGSSTARAPGDVCTATTATMGSAPARHHHGIPVPSMIQEHQVPLHTSPSRPPRLAVVLKSSPTHQTTHVQPDVPVQRTIPHMCELSRRAKEELVAAPPPSEPTAPQPSFVPIPMSISAPKTTLTPLVSSGGEGRLKGWKSGMSYSAMRGNTPPQTYNTTAPQPNFAPIPMSTSAPKSTSTPVASSGKGRPRGWQPGMSYSAMRDKTPRETYNTTAPQPSFVPMPMSTSAPKSTLTPASSGKGRPKGWKPGMSYSAMRGKTPQTYNKKPRQFRQARVNAPPLVWGRRAGRPPKPRSPTPWELYHKSNTQFMTFLCEWSECKAELHNVDTLRRHVHVVHGRRHAPSACRWGQCKTMGFTNAQDWHSHLDQAHFTSFRWHMGDGPRNTSDVLAGLPDGSQDDLPDYLRGSDGQQVTPSVKDQQLEDFVTWRENRRKLKKLLVLRDSNLPDLSSGSSEESD
ncbi:hypothetical protein C2857_001819 [Epichloe festucae Fl1]|uniref:C2H2-type domain-containing protein n=1 Tax=Epichloe festucae (strain Fl1) TaxID=877507 RepID=A0A7S9PRU4_EPIFF|nr:hypothetical protein C2857_001819 [Epichloe festucae Fl1]